MATSEQFDDLTSGRFPWAHAEDHEWVNVHDGSGPKLGAIAELLNRHIQSAEVLIHVLSDSGDRTDLAVAKTAEEAALFVSGHILRGRIHITDPEFTGFVVVDRIGVATGWNAAGAKS